MGPRFCWVQKAQVWGSIRLNFEIIFEVSCMSKKLGPEPRPIESDLVKPLNTNASVETCLFLKMFGYTITHT